MNVGNDDNIVTGVTVKFYIMEAGSFQEVDRTIVDKLVARPYLFIEGAGNCKDDIPEESLSLASGSDTVNLPAGIFGYPGSGAGKWELPGVAMTYNISGISFAWHW